MLICSELQKNYEINKLWYFIILYIFDGMLGFEDLMKGEDSSFGSQEHQKQSSYSTDRDIVNHCLTTFYDQDSNNQMMGAQCSVQQAICYLEHTLDLCDTPLAQIFEVVSVNPMFKGIDLDFFKRKLIKRKNELKRSRAKNRKMIVREHKIVDMAVGQQCQEEEFKKQRNRISAQISRDRKKEKMKALQQLNRKLEEECRQQKAQNQRLREQVEQKRYSINYNRMNKPKNKFTLMLFFLGLMFLCSLIKELFQGSESTKTIAKIQEMASNTMIQDKDMSYYATSEYEPLVLDQIEQTLVETIESKSVAGGIKEKIKSKMESWFPKKGQLMVAQPQAKKEHSL